MRKNRTQEMIGKEASELAYAVKEFSVTPQQLREAIEKFGSSREAVRKHLNR